MKLGTSMFLPSLGIGLAVIALGCQSGMKQSGLQTPALATSDLFVTQSATFTAFKLGTNGVVLHYSLWLELLKPIDKPIKLRVTFQNPEDESKPLVTTLEVPAGTTSVDVESPPVWGLRPARSYEVTVRAYDSAHMLLGTHRQPVQSMVDTRELRRARTYTMQ